METEAEKRMSGWLEVPAAVALWVFESHPLSEYEWQHKIKSRDWVEWTGISAFRSDSYRYRKREPEWIYVSDDDAVREMKAHPDDEWQVRTREGAWVLKPQMCAFPGSQYRRRPRK